MSYSLNIGWLYPRLMSIYGDRGNVICLTKRCRWRDIKSEIIVVDENCSPKQIESCDLILGGGAQDRQQEMVIADLILNKKLSLEKMFAHGVPGLFVCGSPQLLGHFYQTAQGTKISGLDLFDFETIHPGVNASRCIGNTVGEISDSFKLPGLNFKKTIVGFENHGGRTFLGKKSRPFAKVIKGYGNNGQDKTEGALYNNVIACYYHGPFLPKNPHIADWLLTKALESKYHRQVRLQQLEDELEWQAHKFVLKKLGVRN